jgi:hypothetical protein
VGAFGFMFVLGVLPFDEAKPRNQSSIDYHEKEVIARTLKSVARTSSV